MKPEWERRKKRYKEEREGRIKNIKMKFPITQNT